MNEKTPRVVEFTAHLADKQIALFTEYQEYSRRLRNHWIFRLKQFDEFHYFYKKTKSKDGVEEKSGYAPCCPVPWKYRTIKENKEDILVPYTPLIANYHGLRELPTVKMVTPKNDQFSPENERESKGKTTKEWLIDAKINGYQVCVTTSPLLKHFGYQVEDEGMKG